MTEPFKPHPSNDPKLTEPEDGDTGAAAFGTATSFGTKGRDDPDFNDPDAQNAEQSEEGTQAQDVADDAMHRADDPSEDSERGGSSDPADLLPDDVEDLVEKIGAMHRSGRIDMDAYAGEPDMDDEDSPYERGERT